VHGNRLAGWLLSLTLAACAGSAFFVTPIDPSSSTSFTVELSFRVTVVGGGTGGDGMTWVLHSDARGTAALGVGGEYLGVGGIAPSIAVELDTYGNGPSAPDEPAEDHRGGPGDVS
jgi:hypothetical protein